MKKRRNLTAQIYSNLLDQMVQFQIVAGQRLIFIDLARQFEVSRTPVHNALSILEHQGYLDLAPHKGYTVHTFSRREIEELIELKQTMERALIHKINGATNKQLRDILRCKMTFDTVATDNLYRPLARHDLDFHLAVASLADNEPATTLYQETLLKLAMAAINPEAHRPSAQNASREHHEIFEAIRRGDFESAAKHTVNHLPLTFKSARMKARKTKYHQLRQYSEIIGNKNAAV